MVISEIRALQAAFDSFRNELKGIEIITFDELLEKIELQIQIMEGTVFTE